MKYNPSHESLGKPLTKIIRVMRNIGFTPSPDRTTITPEKLGKISEQMDHDITLVRVLLSNGLFSSIVRTHKLLLL